MHALSALGETFPAASAAVLESLLALVTEPVEVEAGAEAGEAGEGAVDVKPGGGTRGRRHRRRSVRALQR